LFALKASLFSPHRLTLTETTISAPQSFLGIVSLGSIVDVPLSSVSDLKTEVRDKQKFLKIRYYGGYRHGYLELEIAESFCPSPAAFKELKWTRKTGQGSKL
jgi:hypothetical protein